MSRIMRVWMSVLLLGLAATGTLIAATGGGAPTGKPSGPLHSAAATRLPSRAMPTALTAATKGAKTRLATRRTRSRSAFRSMSDGRALQLARREFPEVVSKRAFRARRPSAGMKLLRVTGPREAIVQDVKTGREVVAKSTLPMRVRQPSGDLAPVDLTLKETETGAFVPRAALAPVRIGAAADDGVRLDGAKVTIAPSDARAVTGMRSADSVFYPNVYGAQKDTDFITSTNPAGAEVHWQLRSPRADTALALDVDVPVGAKLRRAVPKKDIAGMPRSIEVYQGDKSLAYITPPVAYDADGQPVPTTAEIDGDRVVVNVEHRSRAYHYPIHVDPITGDATSAYVYNYSAFSSEWQPATDGGYFYGYSNGDPAFGYGVVIAMPKNYSYPPSGTAGNWKFTAPANTKIYQAVFGDQVHAAYTLGSYILSGTATGITTPAGWTPGYGYVNQSGGTGGNPFGAYYGSYSGLTQTFRCQSSPCSNFGTNAWLELFAANRYNSATIMTGNQAAYTRMQWATVYLTDDIAPQITNVRRASPSNAPDAGLAPNEQWQDGAASTSVLVDSTDVGVGMRGITVTGATNPSIAFTNQCNAPLPCSKGEYLSYTRNEGINTITATPVDKAGKIGAPRTWTDRLDTTAPTLSSTGIAGNLWTNRNQPTDHRNEILAESTATLTLPSSSVTDAGSGVKELEVRVKNTSGAVVHNSLATLQSGTWTWTNPLTGLADGTYTIQVTARDNLASAGATTGNHVANLPDFSVELDRNGNVQNAREYDDSAGPASGVSSAQEWVRTDATLGERRESGRSIRTRRLISCPASASSQCLEARHVISPEEGESGTDLLSVEIGSTTTDDRVRAFTTVRDPLAAQAPTTTGIALNTVLQQWQVPPPGHGTTANIIERSETLTVDDGAPTTVVTRVWTDAATGLVLRRARFAGGELDGDTYVTYSARAAAPDLPTSHFQAGASLTPTQTTDYAVAGAPAATSEPDETPAERDANEQDFRERFGLDDLVDVDLSVLTDVERKLSLDRWGVRLLPSELTELTNRQSLVDALDAVDNYVAVNNLQSTFGGAYVDHAAGGIVRVFFTQNATSHENAIAALLPIANRLSMQTSSITLAALNSLRDQVAGNWTTLVNDGIQVVSVSRDITDQTVLVGATSPTTAQQQLLTSRYGSRVQLVETQPTEEQAGITGVGSEERLNRRVPPLIGGLHIYYEPIRGGCSTGFALRRGSSYRVLTAGHCGPRGRVWTHFNTVRNRFAAVADQTTTYVANNMDVALLDPAGGRKWVSNSIMSNPGTLTRIRRVATPGQIRISQVVCLSGFRSSKRRCGPIIDPDSTQRRTAPATGAVVPVQQVLYDLGDKDSNSSKGGDSGGAIFNGATAFGIHSGGVRFRGRNIAAFTPMTTILNHYQYSLITSGP